MSVKNLYPLKRLVRFDWIFLLTPSKSGEGFWQKFVIWKNISFICMWYAFVINGDFIFRLVDRYLCKICISLGVFFYLWKYFENLDKIGKNGFLAVVQPLPTPDSGVSRYERSHWSFYQSTSLSVSEWVCLSVWMFPNSSKTAKPGELKFWGMIPFGIGKVFAKKHSYLSNR